MKKLTTVIMVLLASLGSINSGYAQDVIDNTTMNNKIMAGYQGWFGAPNDGSGYGWIHWGDGGGNINAETVTIDYWPDMREYDADELFPTDFVYKDLSNAGLFSSYTTKTVVRHVKWMKDYGIDGVFVQRFISSAKSRRSQRDTVLQNVKYGAEQHGRVFANMYDMSGAKAESFVEDVKTDWMHLVDDLRITESPNYLHHKGLPVLSLWGVNVGGSKDIITPALWIELLNWFTVDAPQKYRVTLKAGVGNGWREDSQDWQAVYDFFEVISPWSVGRYRDNSGADNFRNKYFEVDLNETANRGMEYIPVVFPGFSWTNLYPNDSGGLNKIPRNGGAFFWRQFYNAVDAGCDMVYVAMFDEVDEGTAIFKTTENASQNPTTGNFVTLDMDGYDLPSDWYLRLTGEASKMLRGDIPLTATIPIVARPVNSSFMEQEAPTIMSPGEIVPVSITMENTGTELWTKINNYALFSSVSPTNNSWGITQVDLNDNETINPDESKTFSFNITAPASEGVYEFQWRMKNDGEWFGAASDTRYINVVSGSNLLDDCDALTDWTSSVSLIINTTDQKEGTGCIEFTGGNDKTAEYEKVFATSYNSGLAVYDAVLQFWYYISDATLLGSNFTVGMGSSAAANENEYTWKVSKFATGWNLVTLLVKDAAVTGIPDLDAINWFRLHNAKTGDVTTRIDEIQLFDKYAGAAKYDLVVTNGSGDGKYVEDAIVKISADEAPAGKEFVGWSSVSGKVLFENAKAMTTTLRVFDENLEVKAEYKALGAYLDDCDDLNGWGSSAALVLNTVDQKEGVGCIEFSGNATDEFKKMFSPAYNSGATVESGKLEFWYYTSDASTMGGNQVELGSAGRADQLEYNWNLSGLVNGWNFISLNFSDAAITEGTPDLSAINWFRLYNSKTGSAITRIDAIEIVDPNGGVRHALTVKSGQGDGTYFEGTKVSITADQAPDSYVFDKWIIEEGNPVIENETLFYTTLTMGSGDAIVSATYKQVVKYELVVNNGSGDGTYIPGSTPVINADKAPEGKEFVKWIVNSGTITLSNENATLTYFTMPEENVEVTASYRDIVSVNFKDSYALRIFPNPVKNELSVDFTLHETSDVFISILDLSGRTIGTGLNNLDMLAGNCKVVIPVAEITSGTYMLNIKIDNKILTEVIVVQ